MDKIALKAYAKINIGLDITGKRDDGYHSLKTIYQTVDVFDNLVIKKITEGVIIKTNRPYVPTDERNIAYKAAADIISGYGLTGGVRIDIGKNIPVGAGMAGGSADAAAVIEGMDRLYELHMSQSEKDGIAVRLGADVPFCLRRGTYLAEGIGERLSRINDFPDVSILILVPDFFISTKWAYSVIDDIANCEHPAIDDLVEAIDNGNFEGIVKNMGNSFEKAVSIKHPRIMEVKKMIEDLGAAKAMMSGSGSSIFGIFTEHDKALKAKQALGKYPGKSSIFLTKNVKGEHQWLI